MARLRLLNDGQALLQRRQLHLQGQVGQPALVAHGHCRRAIHWAGGRAVINECTFSQSLASLLAHRQQQTDTACAAQLRQALQGHSAAGALCSSGGSGIPAEQRTLVDLLERTNTTTCHPTHTILLYSSDSSTLFVQTVKYSLKMIIS